MKRKWSEEENKLNNEEADKDKREREKRGEVSDRESAQRVREREG